MKIRPSVLPSIDDFLFAIGEEEIFSFYLGVKIAEGDFIKNPLRKDNNPTVGFFRNNKGRLIMKDFSGWFSGDCINLVSKLYDLSTLDSMYKIHADLNGFDKCINVKKDNSVVKNKTIIRYLIRPWLKSDISYWGQYGISLSTLKYYNVFPVKKVWVNNTIVLNSYEKAYLYKFSDNTCKIYFPERKEYRFVGNSNKAQGFQQLKDADLLVITKSLKDVMVLYECGIASFSFQSESYKLNKSQYNYIAEKYQKIYSLYDYDYAGIVTMNYMKKKFGITPLFFKNQQPAKDISDVASIKGVDFVKTIINKLKQTL